MKTRNIKDSHVFTEKNAERTAKRIETYLGKVSVLKSWEEMSDEIQAANHAYILELRRRVRQEKMYIMHRADPHAVLPDGWST